jgi:hypothetical protein
MCDESLPRVLEHDISVSQLIAHLPRQFRDALDLAAHQLDVPVAAAIRAGMATESLILKNGEFHSGRITSQTRPDPAQSP